MNGELQHKVDTTLDTATAMQLQRYCTRHGIKRREAVRRAIVEMLRREPTEPPKLDHTKPL